MVVRVLGLLLAVCIARVRARNATNSRVVVAHADVLASIILIAFTLEVGGVVRRLLAFFVIFGLVVGLRLVSIHFLLLLFFSNARRLVRASLFVCEQLTLHTVFLLLLDSVSCCGLLQGFILLIVELES